MHAKAYSDITAAFARLVRDLNQYIASLPPAQQQAAAAAAAAAINRAEREYKALMMIENLRQAAHLDQLDERELRFVSRPRPHLEAVGPRYRDLLRDPEFQRKFLNEFRKVFPTFPANGTIGQAIEILNRTRDASLSKLDEVYKAVSGKERPKQ